MSTTNGSGGFEITNPPDPSPTLVVVPMLRAFVDDDSVVLTKKFMQGIEEQRKCWPGPIRVLMQPTAVETDDLDRVRVPKAEVPFDLTVCPLDSEPAARMLDSASIALLALGWDQNDLPALCKQLGVQFAVVAENTLKNRIEIARAEVSNPLRLARRILWEIGQERHNRKSVAMSVGLQCNGTPTFDAYSRFSPTPMLFFDTRTSAEELATVDQMERRFAQRRSSGRLRLAFSGRLIAIKGVDHLVRVAGALANMGRDFSLAICGAGALEQSMRDFVHDHGLGKVVRFLGSLDFRSELLPFLRDEIDLFVSCHRQGDPSCTYIETMACGVPIAGYDNDAWKGLVRTSGCGWATPVDKIDALAGKIESLSDADIEEHSLASLRFASAHTFETEFERRMVHLRTLIGESTARTSPTAPFGLRQRG